MNIARVEERLVVIREDVGVPTYDFDFDLHFTCSHPQAFAAGEVGVLRVGAFLDYAAEFSEQGRRGLTLVNSPAEHVLASELEAWYPRLSDLTPRTRVYEQLPGADSIEAEFDWPIFLKGSRQTSRHDPELSVIAGAAQYEAVARAYRSDPILRWQKPAVRELVPLAPVRGRVAGKIGPALEFRSFWWHGECVGWGPYWHQVPHYEDADSGGAGLAVAGAAAARLAVPFLVVDFAKTRDGRWIVIECNDAQESGYAAIPPYLLWRRVLDAVAGRKT